jgi:DNA-binding NtrC family response regulator
MPCSDRLAVDSLLTRPGSSARLLIVEDDVIFRVACESFFADSGFDVHASDNVEAALEQFRSFCPTVVLTDLRLPSAKEGLQLLKRLREIVPDISVVVYTVLFDAAEECYRLGASWVLPKPFDFGALFRVIKGAMEGLLAPASQAALERFLHRVTLQSELLGRLEPELLRQARSATTALLVGEEWRADSVARLIHALGARHLEALVTLG